MVRIGKLIGGLWIGLVACSSPPPEQPAASPEPAAPVSQGYVSTQYLLETNQLHRLMENGVPVVLIDLRKTEEYAQGHLPGAQAVWRPDIQDLESYPYGGMRMSEKQATALLSKLGVTPETKVVIYDAKGGVDAARLWWILLHYGHNNVALLNGGLPAWQASGYPTTTELPTITPSHYAFCGQPTTQWFANRDQVLEATTDPQVVLIDTRTTDEYTGAEQKSGAFKPGRITSSIHLDYYRNIDTSPEGHMRFKSYEDLKAMYDEAGITPDHSIIAYCHSGVRSAHTTFVLTQLLGYPQVANYDGSWTEWSYYDELPFETDATPVAQ